MQISYGKGFEIAAKPLEIREQILKLEAAMLAQTEGIDIGGKTYPLRHYRADGMIAREILLRKHSIVVGKIHKHAHLNLISLGHVRVLTEDGAIEMKAPLTFTSSVGTKRVVYALEDTVWTTFHLNPNNLDPESEDDMIKLENEIIAKSYDDVPQIAGQKPVLEVVA